jgi:hypothetical protein
MKIDKFEDYDFALKQITKLYNVVKNSKSQKADSVSELVNMGFKFGLNGNFYMVKWDESSLCTILITLPDLYSMVDGDSDIEDGWDIKEISYSELKELIK